MDRQRVALISAASVLAVGLAMMAHEGAHVLVGRMAGGSPTLMTATEVKGDFDALSPAGFVAFGSAGSLVNVLLCGLGAWTLRRRTSADVRLVAWFFFSVNGMLVTTKMIGEGLTGFGDLMTVLHSLPAPGLLRAATVVIGAACLILLVRRSGAALGAIVPPGEAARRKAEARRIVGIGAAAAAVLVLGGTVANPVGTTRGTLLAVGVVLGAFLPMLSAARFVTRSEPREPVRPATGGWPWLAGAGATALLLWLVVGPGLRL